MEETQKPTYDNLVVENNNLRLDYGDLKLKCNRLIDHVHALEEAINNMDTTDNPQAARFCYPFNIFYSTITDIIRDNAYLEPKNATQNTTKYMLVEYKTFSQYVSRFAGEEHTKRLYERFILFRLVIPHDSGGIAYPYKYEGKSIRIVKVDKSVVDFVRECMTNA